MTKWQKLLEVTRIAIEETPPNTGRPQQVPSLSIPMTTKELRAILLETGGTFKVTARATVFSCSIYKKSLGCGVYNVWGVAYIPHEPI